MSYSTEFNEYFTLTPNLSSEQIATILQIARSPNQKWQPRPALSGAPFSWCHWIPNHYGNHLAWDGGERFYDYVEWLEYLIEFYFKPWGVVVSGEIDWQGDDCDDRGIIFAKDNKVEAVRSRIQIDNPGPSWKRMPCVDVAGGTVFLPRKNT
jgi:hypothetical protein